MTHRLKPRLFMDYSPQRNVVSRLIDLFVYFGNSIGTADTYPLPIPAFGDLTLDNTDGMFSIGGPTLTDVERHQPVRFTIETRQAQPDVELVPRFSITGRSFTQPYDFTYLSLIHI